jgi:hypothetical protein
MATIRIPSKEEGQSAAKSCSFGFDEDWINPAKIDADQ